MTEHYIKGRLDSIRYSPYQPVPIVDDVTLDTIVFLKERPELFPKVNVVRRSIRVYPNGSIAPRTSSATSARSMRTSRSSTSSGATAPRR